MYLVKLNDLGPAKQATIIDQGIVKLGGQL